MTTATATAPTRRVDRNGYGFSIRQEDGAWFGYEWQRRSCFEVDSTCITGPMTEAEAAAWIAAF
ncbi:MAG: hypothetical protein EBZ51_07505 [Synechococcaceae bacterium WB9_2_112]|nr:hypothetical protein [Synechococcaceae bacterium WB9_2_112]